MITGIMFEAMITFKKKILLIVGVGLFFLWHLHNIKPESTYAIDSLVKLVQAISIQKNHFESEELVYLAKTYDPTNELHPLPTFIIHAKGKTLSPFSVNFAGFNAGLLTFFRSSHLPYVCLFFSIFTLFFLAKSSRISIPTLILACFGTPLVYQGLEYSENSMLLALQGLGLYFYYLNDNRKNRFLAAFFLALGIFLRLETILFIAFFYLFQLILVYRFHIFKFLQNEWSTLFGTFLPVFLFCLQNLFLYDHILGARFLSNQSTLLNFHVFDRLIQMRNLIFLTYFKIGFFGFTPIFLLAMIYLFYQKKKIENKKDLVLLYTLLVFIPITALIAPNDGVTNWGARYMNLAILPSLLLFNTFYDFWKTKESKLKKYSLILLFCYSFLILGLGLKFQQVATKEIRLFQEDLTSQTANLHVLGAETIGLYSGTHFYDTILILPKTAEQLEQFLNKNHSKIASDDKILLSRIKPTPGVKEGIKVGLFPAEAHYESLLSVLRKKYPKETQISGKKLNFHQFSK